MSVTFRKCEWKNCGSEFQASRKDQAHCSKSCQTQDARWKRNAEKREARIKERIASRKTLNRYSLTESVPVGEVIGKTKGQEIQVEKITIRLSSLPVRSSDLQLPKRPDLEAQKKLPHVQKYIEDGSKVSDESWSSTEIQSSTTTIKIRF
jgi:hypothetical protein